MDCMGVDWFMTGSLLKWPMKDPYKTGFLSPLSWAMAYEACKALNTKSFISSLGIMAILPSISGGDFFSKGTKKTSKNKFMPYKSRGSGEL